MLMLNGYDLSVIAIIGVILLIGIVKKNAIMMIDFALQAERIEGMSPREAIHQGLPVTLPPDYDDNLRRVVRRHADRPWPWRGIGTAAATGHRDHRWFVGVAMRTG